MGWQASALFLLSLKAMAQAIPSPAFEWSCEKYNLFADNISQLSNLDRVEGLEGLLSLAEATNRKGTSVGFSGLDEPCLKASLKSLGDILAASPPELRTDPLFLLAQGRYFYLKNENEEARKSFEAVLALNQDNFPAHVAFADLYASKKDGVKEAFHRARIVELAPRPLTESFRALVMDSLERLSLGLEVNAERAKDWAKQWLELEGKNTAARNRILELALENKNSFLLSLISAKSKEPEKTFLQAELLTFGGKCNEGASLYAKYIKKTEVTAKYQVKARLRLAECLVEQQKAKEAIGVLEAALRIAPADVSLIELHEKVLSDYKPTMPFGVADWQRAVDLNPTSKMITLKFCEAVLGYDRSAAISSGDSENSESGDAAELLVQTQAHLERLISAEPNDPEILAWQGVWLRKKGLFTKAEMILERAFSVLGDKEIEASKTEMHRSDLAIELARVKRARGHRGESQDVLREAMKLAKTKTDRDRLNSELRAP